MLVVDASVLFTSLADDGLSGRRLRRRFRTERIAIPEIADLEIVSVLRRHLRAGLASVEQAVTVLARLAVFQVERHSHAPLVPRVWELRDNVSAYDAGYVALAETLGATLLTGDTRLSRAPGLRCEVEIITG